MGFDSQKFCYWTHTTDYPCILYKPFAESIEYYGWMAVKKNLLHYTCAVDGCKEGCKVANCCVLQRVVVWKNGNPQISRH